MNIHVCTGQKMQTKQVWIVYEEGSLFPDEGIQGEKDREHSKSPALQNIQTNVFCLFFTLWSVA